MRSKSVFVHFVWIWTIVTQNIIVVSCDKDCFIENIARNKTASQSSQRSGGFPEHAVDGNIDTYFENGSCTHTNDTGERWWKVDLGVIAEIQNITITNRNATTKEVCNRLKKFEICLSNSTNDTLNDPNPKCQVQQEPLRCGETKSYVFRSAGQIVFIKKNTTDETGALTMCEVQVLNEVCSSTTMSPTKAAKTTRCESRTNNTIPHTEEELVEKISALKSELTVDKKQTSKSKRRLISAPDDRTTSRSIGFVAILIMCVPVVLILASDVSSCVTWWRGKKVIKQNKNKKMLTSDFEL